MTNAFYFMFKAYFVLVLVLTFLVTQGKKADVNSKIYDVAD